MDTKETTVQKLFNTIERTANVCLKPCDIKTLVEAYRILVETEIMYKAMEKEFAVEQRTKVATLPYIEKE